MADVFVSYSRKDAAFGQRLHDALVGRQLDVWMDREDIPPTAEWWHEIEMAIEGSDCFVFVLSPDSIASETCRRELEHAERNRKRIVPLLHREVGAGTAPPVIQERQWLSFLEGDDFEGALNKLDSAIRTDLDLVRAHTRILARALEWQRSAHGSSALLRGVELRDAQRWLKRLAVADGALQPTPLHEAYILASIRSTTLRRWMVVGLLALGTLSAILAVQAERESRRQKKAAEEEQAKKEAQEAIALANGLVSASVSLRTEAPSHLTCSVLLALEAARRHPSAAADLALRSGLDLLRHRVWSTSLGVKVNAVSLGKRHAALAGGEGLVHIIDAETGLPVARFQEQGEVFGIAFSNDDRALVTAGFGGVCMHEEETGWIPVIVQRGASRSAAVSPDGRWIAAGGWDGAVTLVDGKGFSSERIMHHDMIVNTLAFSPDGRYLATGSNDRSARIWDPTSGEELARLPHEQGVLCVSFSADGSQLATITWNSVVRIWRVDQPLELTRFELNSACSSVALSPDGRWLATACDGGTAQLWDTSSNAEVARLIHQGAVTSVAFGPDGRRLVTGSEDGSAALWEACNGRELMRTREDGLVTSVGFDSKGRLLVGVEEYARLTDIASGDDVTRVSHSGRIDAAVLSFDDALLATASAVDGSLRIWSAADGRELQRLPCKSAHCELAFGHRSSLLAVSGDRSLATIWEVGGVQPRLTTTIGGGELLFPSSLAFDGEDEVLCTGENDPLHAGQDTAVKLWDVRDGHLVHGIDVGHGAREVSFSPDGHWLAVACADAENTVQVLDVTTSEANCRLPHPAEVTGLAFSPDGRYLATSAADRTARVWEVASQQTVAEFLHGGKCNAVAFSRDGRLLATASSDRTARVWHWLREDPGADACGLLTRNLSTEEWLRYIGTETYRRSCPDLP